MPTYAYRCTMCAHEFDAVQKFSDDPITICPECTGVIRRVFQPVGVVFKGSGWYINDSRGKAASKTDAPKKTDAASSADGSKSESKTADTSSPAASTDTSAKTAKSAAD